MITLTEKAARHVSSHLAKRGKGIGLRLGVKTTGCSGLAYKLEYADAANPEDHVFESHDVKVLIDPKTSAGYARERDDGALTWRLKLGAGERRTLDLAFRLEVPASYEQ